MQQWRAHEQRMCALSWALDGRRLASGGNDGAVLVWDGETGERLATLNGHTGAVRSLDWSRDGLLASAAEDGSVIVWDPAESALCSRLPVHSSWVNAVRWSPGGGRLASAGGDQTLVVTSADDGAEMARLPSPFGTFLSIEWSPDGESLAACSRSPLVTVWNTADWTPTSRLSSGGGTVWSVEWLRAGRWLAAGDADGRVVIWDLESQQPARVIEGHVATVSRVASVGAGQLLASLSHDQSIAVWDVSEANLGGPKLLARKRDAYPGWTGCVAAHPHEDVLAAPDSSGRDILVWRINRPADLFDQPPPGGGDSYRDPELAAADETIRDARREGAATVRLSAVVDAAVERGEPPARAVKIARTAARHLEIAGEVLRLGASEHLFFGTAALPDILHAVVADAAALPDGDGALRLHHVPPWLLPDPAIGGVALVHLLVRGGSGWWSPGDDGGTLSLPQAATRPLPPALAELAGSGPRWPLMQQLTAAELIGSMIATTLFRRVALYRDAAVLADTDGGTVVVASQPGEAGADELCLGVAAAAGSALDRRRSVLVSLVDRLLDYRPDPERPSVPSSTAPATPPARWHVVDPAAERTWALSFDGLADDDAVAAGALLERVEDERQRLCRLVANGVRGEAEFDIAVAHGPQDLPDARQLRDELAVLGVRAWIDEDGQLGADEIPPDVLEVGLRAGVVAVLLGAGGGQAWEDGPLARVHQRLLELADSPSAPRLWWVPILLPSAPDTPLVPDHLHSFDWYHWRSEPRAQRHAALSSLLGGVFLDRARQ